MNAIFLKLLNMSAAGSVLILAVVVLRALLKRAPRWIICVMWAVVAVRLVCPVSIVSPLSAFQATPSIVSESGEVEVFRPAGGSEKPLLAVDTVQIERPRANAETITEIPGTSLAVTQRSRDTYLPPLIGLPAWSGSHALICTDQHLVAAEKGICLAAAERKYPLM